MNNFKKLGLNDQILETIQKHGFTDPTKIQEKSIPFLLNGRDVIAGSKTGSGKTLAFTTAIIHKVEKSQGIQALVLTPTRELAEQVSKSVKDYSRHKGLVVSAVYGGVSINPQIEKLYYTDVVVGTPGRILDHLSRHTLNLGKIKLVILDEADRMLDMGFIDDVNKILYQCPKNRQTLLYSATISSDIYNIAEQHMHNPVKISVDVRVDTSKLSQIYYQVPQNLKFSLLVHLLKMNNSGLVMVFCNTQRATDYVAKNLNKQDINAIAIHGGLSQAKRSKTMQSFHSRRKDVLVCTDVAARGLHIEDVTHIYNYDVPKESKQYIHRIGRTARAGKNGKAITLLTQRDYENFDRVQKDNNNVDIPRKETPHIERLSIAPMKKTFRRMRRSKNLYSHHYSY